MNVQLFRIDDRLIHGQVVIGWVAFLNSHQILLCDDAVYENNWEKELYLSIVPENIKTLVLDVNQTAQLLSDPQNDLSRTIILVNSPLIVEKLLNLGVQLSKINIGGIHFREGREKYLPYLYLSKTELESLQASMQKGTHFDCQDMPQSKAIPLEKLLNKKKNG